ncbi:Serine/threonine-protein kinase tricorner [Gryllus bimaculatus]|nr:Serine/threonine-protein kinase tricorner [Gryllus bimaculatus]
MVSEKRCDARLLKRMHMVFYKDTNLFLHHHHHHRYYLPHCYFPAVAVVSEQQQLSCLVWPDPSKRYLVALHLWQHSFHVAQLKRQTLLTMAAEEPQEVENWVRQRVLGSGGFGVVTLWKHKHREEMIALKKCRSGTDNLLTPKHKERWSKEVEIMQRLSHPNVVKAIQVPSDLAVLRSELPLLCMEFCSKGDLRQILNRGENCCGLQENDVRTLISDVKNAVQYLHSMKITHRDLKPENIVLQQNESRIVYKLIDLGYAKELDQSSICTSFVGTLQYLAPELFMSKAMNHIRNKSSDDISAYEDQDGSIVFCREIFPENHITVTLKYHMEEWFKTLLEWDPKKRGRNKDMKVMVFDLAEKIFNKKIVQLFCVTTYKKWSYEIDDSTAVSTLKEWIRRDTGIPVEEQELILANGKSVDVCNEASQCWIAQNVKDGTPMVYIYRLKQFSIPQVTPRIPSRVSKMMEEPRVPMEYIHLKRAWAHAVFFLQQECELYRTFRHSHTVKLLHIFIKCEHLKQKSQLLNTQLQQARAEQYLTPQSIQQKWIQNRNSLASDMIDVSKKASEMQGRCDIIRKKMATLQSDPHLRIHEPNILRTLMEAGLKCYDQLRRRPREARSQRSDSIEMVKVVYNCLKQRDILLRDKEFNIHLQQVVELQIEMENLLHPLEQCIDKVKELRLKICQCQLDRQKDVWNLVVPEKTLDNNLQTQPMSVKTNLHFNPSNLEDSEFNLKERKQLMSESSMTPSIPVSTTSLPVSSNIDTSTIIQDNIELRHLTLDAMHESYRKFANIVGDSLNWSHLE